MTRQAILHLAFALDEYHDHNRISTGQARDSAQIIIELAKQRDIERKGVEEYPLEPIVKAAMMDILEEI